MKRQTVLNTIVALLRLTMAKLTFTETLIWHAIKGRVHNGVATATDRQIAAEVALAPAMVTDLRRGLQAAGLIETTVAFAGRLEIDNELLIVIRKPELAAAT